MNDRRTPRRTIGPALAGVAAAALLVWLAGRVADLLLLLFIAILLAVYLGATTDFLVARTRLPRGAAFAVALLGSLAGVFGVGSLLAGPVVAQTRELISVLPRYIPAWEAQLEALMNSVHHTGRAPAPSSGLR